MLTLFFVCFWSFFFFQYVSYPLKLDIYFAFCSPSSFVPIYAWNENLFWHTYEGWTDSDADELKSDPLFHAMIRYTRGQAMEQTNQTGKGFKGSDTQIVSQWGTQQIRSGQKPRSKKHKLRSYMRAQHEKDGKFDIIWQGRFGKENKDRHRQDNERQVDQMRKHRWHTRETREKGKHRERRKTQGSEKSTQIKQELKQRTQNTTWY